MAPGRADGKVVVAYLSSWAAYRPMVPTPSIRFIPIYVLTSFMHSPDWILNSRPLSHWQFTIDYLLKLDAPPGKIVMGLPFYGRTYETVGNGNIGDKTEGAGFQGPYTRENGIMGFNEICQELKNNSDWSTSWDGEASQVLARRRRGGRMQVISFDSTRSIANKVKFAMDRKLAGVMIWSIDTDDFQGCSQSDEHTFDD